MRRENMGHSLVISSLHCFREGNRCIVDIKKISKSVARLDAEVQNTLKLNEELLEGQIKKPQPKK